LGSDGGQVAVTPPPLHQAQENPRLPPACRRPATGLPAVCWRPGGSRAAPAVMAWLLAGGAIVGFLVGLRFKWHGMARPVALAVCWLPWRFVGGLLAVCSFGRFVGSLLAVSAFCWARWSLIGGL
jgi:hypothetical protein